MLILLLITLITFGCCMSSLGGFFLAASLSEILLTTRSHLLITFNDDMHLNIEKKAQRNIMKLDERL